MEKIWIKSFSKFCIPFCHIGKQQAEWQCIFYGLLYIVRLSVEEKGDWNDYDEKTVENMVDDRNDSGGSLSGGGLRRPDGGSE